MNITVQAPGSINTFGVVNSTANMNIIYKDTLTYFSVVHAHFIARSNQY